MEKILVIIFQEDIGEPSIGKGMVLYSAVYSLFVLLGLDNLFPSCLYQINSTPGSRRKQRTDKPYPFSDESDY